SMRTSLHMDRIHDLSIFQNRDRARINVADVNRIVRRDNDVTPTSRCPRFDKLCSLVNNDDSLVVAVGNEHAAPGIDGHPVRQLKLAGSITFDAADDFDELSILRKLHYT